MVVAAQRDGPTIGWLHTFAGWQFVARQADHPDVRRLRRARAPLDVTAGLASYESQVSLVSKGKFTLPEFAHVGTPHEAQPCSHSVPNFLDFQPSQRAFSQASLKSDVSVSKTSGQESHSKTSLPYERSIIAATDLIQLVREFDYPNTTQRR